MQLLHAGTPGLCVPLPPAAVMSHAVAALEFNIYTLRRPEARRAVFRNNPIAAGQGAAIFIPALQQFLLSCYGKLWLTVTGNSKKIYI